MIFSLAKKYDMKFKTSVGTYSVESATFTLYLIKIDITAPPVPDPIPYFVKATQKSEFIPAFTMTPTPPAVTGWDISTLNWSYELIRDD